MTCHCDADTVHRFTSALHSYYDSRTFLWHIVGYIHDNLSLGLFAYLVQALLANIHSPV